MALGRVRLGRVGDAGRLRRLRLGVRTRPSVPAGERAAVAIGAGSGVRAAPVPSRGLTRLGRTRTSAAAVWLGHANLGITSIYLQGIDSSEIIATVHSRPAPVI